MGFRTQCRRPAGDHDEQQRARMGGSLGWLRGWSRGLARTGPWDQDKPKPTFQHAHVRAVRPEAWLRSISRTHKYAQCHQRTWYIIHFMLGWLKPQLPWFWWVSPFTIASIYKRGHCLYFTENSSKVTARTWSRRLGAHRPAPVSCLGCKQKALHEKQLCAWHLANLRASLSPSLFAIGPLGSPPPSSQCCSWLLVNHESTENCGAMAGLHLTLKKSSHSDRTRHCNRKGCPPQKPTWEVSSMPTPLPGLLYSEPQCHFKRLLVLFSSDF